MPWQLALSAIMIVGAFVLVEVTADTPEASMTGSPSSPRTLSSSSTRQFVDQGKLSGHRWRSAGIVMI
jgi:hypothetical protein